MGGVEVIPRQAGTVSGLRIDLLREENIGVRHRPASNLRCLKEMISTGF